MTAHDSALCGAMEASELLSVLWCCSKCPLLPFAPSRGCTSTDSSPRSYGNGRLVQDLLDTRSKLVV